MKLALLSLLVASATAWQGFKIGGKDGAAQSVVAARSAIQTVLVSAALVAAPTKAPAELGDLEAKLLTGQAVAEQSAPAPKEPVAVAPKEDPALELPSVELPTLELPNFDMTSVKGKLKQLSSLRAELPKELPENMQVLKNVEIGQVDVKKYMPKQGDAERLGASMRTQAVAFFDDSLQRAKDMNSKDLRLSDIDWNDKDVQLKAGGAALALILPTLRPRPKRDTGDDESGEVLSAAAAAEAEAENVISIPKPPSRAGTGQVVKDVSADQVNQLQLLVKELQLDLAKERNNVRQTLVTLAEERKEKMQLAADLANLQNDLVSLKGKVQGLQSADEAIAEAAKVAQKAKEQEMASSAGKSDPLMKLVESSNGVSAAEAAADASKAAANGKALADADAEAKAKAKEAEAKAKAKEAEAKAKMEAEAAAKKEAEAKAKAKAKAKKEPAAKAAPKAPSGTAGADQDWRELPPSRLKRKTVADLQEFLNERGLPVRDDEGRMMKKPALLDAVSAYLSS